MFGSMSRMRSNLKEDRPSCIAADNPSRGREKYKICTNIMMRMCVRRRRGSSPDSRESCSGKPDDFGVSHI